MTNYSPVIIEATPDSALGYQFYGGAREFWRYKGHEALLAGPYDTGKTLVALSKLHALLCIHAGATALMVRDTYSSLISSAVVTYETKVLPVPPEDPRSFVDKYGASKPEWYDYWNGSRLVLGGLDKPDKFLSSEFDYVYINQLEELDLNSYELLKGRATGRAGHVPYPQVMADCNPSTPWHWILERVSRGELKLFEQKHEHNPSLFNQETGEITPDGIVRMKALDSLTGIRYLRGRLGLWVAAEGVVYDNFEYSENVSEDADYNPALSTVWGVDDGYAHGEGMGTPGHHPRVILVGQQRGDGGFNIVDEYYQTLTLPEASIAEMLSRPYARPDIALVDSSAAELRRRLADAGIVNAGNTHRVADGIKVVRRFICDGNGMRLLKIHPRCVNLIRELQSYRYNPAGVRSEAGEPVPLKIDDHAADALRYLLFNYR